MAQINEVDESAQRLSPENTSQCLSPLAIDDLESIVNSIRLVGFLLLLTQENYVNQFPLLIWCSFLARNSQKSEDGCSLTASGYQVACKNGKVAGWHYQNSRFSLCSTVLSAVAPHLASTRNIDLQFAFHQHPRSSRSNLRMSFAENLKPQHGWLLRWQTLAREASWESKSNKMQQI